MAPSRGRDAAFRGGGWEGAESTLARWVPRPARASLALAALGWLLGIGVQLQQPALWPAAVGRRAGRGGAAVWRGGSVLASAPGRAGARRAGVRWRCGFATTQARAGVAAGAEACRPRSKASICSRHRRRRAFAACPAHGTRFVFEVESGHARWPGGDAAAARVDGLVPSADARRRTADAAPSTARRPALAVDGAPASAAWQR